MKTEEKDLIDGARLKRWLKNEGADADSVDVLEAVESSRFQAYGIRLVREPATVDLKKGDYVVMHTCMEAENPKYAGKLWRCKSDPVKQKGRDYGVIFLEGFSGFFAVEFLQRVDLSVLQAEIDAQQLVIESQDNVRERNIQLARELERVMNDNDALIESKKRHQNEALTAHLIVDDLRNAMALLEGELIGDDSERSKSINKILKRRLKPIDRAFAENERMIVEAARKLGMLIPAEAETRELDGTQALIDFAESMRERAQDMIDSGDVDYEPLSVDFVREIPDIAEEAIGRYKVSKSITNIKTGDAIAALCPECGSGMDALNGEIGCSNIGCSWTDGGRDVE